MNQPEDGRVALKVVGRAGLFDHQHYDRHRRLDQHHYTTGLLTRITDTYGRFDQLSYNSHKLPSVVEPDGDTTTFTYDPRGIKCQYGPGHCRTKIRAHVLSL